MRSNRNRPLVNSLALLVVGLATLASSPGAAANEPRDECVNLSMTKLTGRSSAGLRELSDRVFVQDKSTLTVDAAEAFPTDVDALAPYLEMHGRAEAGVRPIILPWSVRMESVN